MMWFLTALAQVRQFIGRWMPRRSTVPKLDAFWVLNMVWLAQAIATFVQLGLVEYLEDEARSVDEMACHAGVESSRLDQIVRALAAFEILKFVRPNRYSLGPRGLSLSRNREVSLADYVTVWSSQLYPAAARMCDQVRGTRTAFDLTHGAPLWTFYSQHPGAGQDFDKFMNRVTEFHVESILRAFPFGRYRSVVDVGAGRGYFLKQMLERFPQLRGTWLDRSELLDAGRATFSGSSSSHRVNFVCGDFLSAVPAGADLYTIKHVLHDWNNELCSQIVGRIAQAMRSDSTLLILEAVLDEPGDVDALLHLRSLDQLIWTGGRCRSRQEFATLLAPHGLQIRDVVPTGVVDIQVIHVTKRISDAARATHSVFV
jgi:hypothetical protein